jgi:hypothetical protein
MNNNPITSLVEGIRGALTPKSKDERDQHPAAVPELSAEELAKKFEKAKPSPAIAQARFLSEHVKPRDRYGRRRVFDVAHHTKANRADRRAVAKSRGVRMAPGFNKPYVRGGAR